MLLGTGRPVSTTSWVPMPSCWSGYRRKVMTPDRRVNGRSCFPPPYAGWSKRSPSARSGHSSSPPRLPGKPPGTEALVGGTFRW
eukprot:9736813-Alexandrium_andersonii.AAC.1